MKNKPDIKLESVGCVSALEFVGLKLSACVNLTSTDIIRVIESLNTNSDAAINDAYKLVIRSLGKKIKTVSFTSPIAGCGRVTLVPDLKNKNIQNKFIAMMDASKKKAGK